MSAVSKKIEKGQPMGRRDTLRVGGTGCICSVPEYRETSGETVYSFLHVKVISNSIRKNKDGSADQFSEFTDITLSGNRAKALATVLAKGQTIEFSGRLRTRSFESKTFHDQNGKAAQIYRTECVINQDGWVHIMKDAENGEKASLSVDTNQAANANVDMKTLQDQMAIMLNAIRTGQPVPHGAEVPAAEATIDVKAEEGTIDAPEIPF